MRNTFGDRSPRCHHPPPESNDAARPWEGESGAAKTVDNQPYFYRPRPRLPQVASLSLTAELIPPVHQEGKRFVGDRYTVAFDGEIIGTGHNAELDACRVLLARGYTGTLTFIDAITGKPRLTVDIERGARLTVKEAANGPRFCRFRTLSAPAPVAEAEGP